MAIIIEQDINEYSPAYNDINVVVNSTNDGEIDFKYVFDLYIDGVAGFTRFKVAPEPQTSHNYGVKNFGNILEAYINAYILKDDTLLNGGFLYMQDGIKKFNINYGEEYRLTANDPIVVYPDLLIGSDKYIWNASLSYNEYVDYNFNNIKNDWLTTNKEVNNISINNVGYSGIISDVSSDIEFLEVKTYDSAGVLIDTYQITNLANPITTDSKYMSVATAPKNLNAITVGLTLGSQPIIDSSVSSYTCQILDAGLSGLSGLMYFTIKEQCNYPIRRLHFQNKWGAFDSFNFDLVSKESVNIDKKSYKFNSNRLDASGFLSYEKSDRSNVNYYIKTTDQIELNANWITEEQSIWLEELFTSPEIYLEDATFNGKLLVSLISVSEIQSKTYQIKTTKVDKLFNVNVIITLSNNNYRQRR